MQQDDEGATYWLKYALGSSVYIASDVVASIVSVEITVGGSKLYKCEWFNNGAVQNHSFYEEQLQAIGDTSK